MPSEDPLSINEESAEKAASQTQFECPDSVETRVILASSEESSVNDQFLIKPSDPIVTRILKSIK